MLLYGFSTMESSQTTIPDCLAGVFLSLTFPGAFLRIIVVLPQCDTPGFNDYDWDRFSRATFAGGRFNLPFADLWTFEFPESAEIRRILPPGLDVGETCRISYADALSLVDSLNVFYNSRLVAQREADEEAENFGE